MYIDYHLGEVLIQRNLDVLDASIALAIPLEDKRHINTYGWVGRDGRTVSRRCKVGSYLGISVLEAPDGAGFGMLYVVRFAAVNSKELAVAIYGQAAANLQCLGHHEK